MIRVYISRDGGSMADVLRTPDPTEAEAHYLHLVQQRTEEPATVVVHPPRGDARCAPGRYRIDRAWAMEARESDPDRRAQLWAPASAWTGPTPWQLRALPAASGLSGAEIARRIGVEVRTWRRWLSEEDAQGTRIPYTAWIAALRMAGLLPDDELRGAPAEVGHGP
jgi:hypothetical protein